MNLVVRACHIASREQTFAVTTDCRFTTLRLFLSNASLSALTVTLLNQPAGGVATQGLQQDKLFAFDSVTGLPRPQLQLLAVPVRALVAPLSDAAVAKALSEAVAAHLTPLLPPGGLWPQDPALYHTTLWHASRHQVRHAFMSFTVSGPSCRIFCVSLEYTVHTLLQSRVTNARDREKHDERCSSHRYGWHEETNVIIEGFITYQQHKPRHQHDSIELFTFDHAHFRGCLKGVQI